MENYRGVIRKVKVASEVKLAPFSSEAEAARDETKANDHIPSPNMGDRILGVADVIGHDPDQADEEAGEHKRGEPLWALLRQGSGVRYLVRNVNRIFLAAFGLRHE